MNDYKKCKICESDKLIEFISFGDMPVANAFLKFSDLEKEEYKYKMSVGFCENCHMVQLMDVVPYDKYIIPNEMGETEYAFFSSTSKFMEKHFFQLAKEVEEKFLKGNEKVVEIGSNDGIMLKAFEKRDEVIGIEPSQNVAEIAQKQGIKTVTEFFSEDLAKKLIKKVGKFRTVLSTNVTLNIIDLHDFMRGVNELLDEKGVFITEDPYLPNILKNRAYDQIYDEHIWYFSLDSLSKLYEKHGMEIFDCEEQWVHGGSMRVYACKKGAYNKTERFEKALELEREKKIDNLMTYAKFASEVQNNRKKLNSLLSELKNQGNKIIGYAASCKGTIVQNYCNIDKKTLDYISDSTPMKQGMFSPGMKIPIVSPEKFGNDKKVDYALLFVWNHAKEVLEKEKEFLNRGGKFIVHLPEPRILGNYEN